MNDLDTMKITAKKLPVPSRWKRRGRVERQESRCRRRGFANVWLTGVRRRDEKEREREREGDERGEAGRPDVVSAERRQGGEEGRKGDAKRGTMTKTRGGGVRGAWWRRGRGRAEGRGLEGPRSKTVYNEEAAGRSVGRPAGLEPVPPIIAAPRRPSASRDFPSSSHATRTSSDRPDAPAAAPHTVHQLRPVRTRARSPSLFAARPLSLPLPPPSSSFLFETSLQRAVSFLPLARALLSLELRFLFSSGAANVFRVFSSSSSTSASSAEANERADPRSSFLPRPVSLTIVSPRESFLPSLSRLLVCTAPRHPSLSLPHPPADRTHTGVAHYPI